MGDTQVRMCARRAHPFFEASVGAGCVACQVEADALAVARAEALGDALTRLLTPVRRLALANALETYVAGGMEGDFSPERLALGLVRALDMVHVCALVEVLDPAGTRWRAEGSADVSQ